MGNFYRLKMIKTRYPFRKMCLKKICADRKMDILADISIKERLMGFEAEIQIIKKRTKYLISRNMWLSSYRRSLGQQKRKCNVVEIKKLSHKINILNRERDTIRNEIMELDQYKKIVRYEILRIKILIGRR
jgi:hypothetical protein